MKELTVLSISSTGDTDKGMKWLHLCLSVLTNQGFSQCELAKLEVSRNTNTRMKVKEGMSAFVIQCNLVN